MGSDVARNYRKKDSDSEEENNEEYLNSSPGRLCGLAVSVGESAPIIPPSHVTSDPHRYDWLLR